MRNFLITNARTKASNKILHFKNVTDGIEFLFNINLSAQKGMIHFSERLK